VQLWNDSKRPEDVRKVVDTTIATLKCSYLDLLLIEWPQAWKPGTQEADPGAAHVQFLTLALLFAVIAISRIADSAFQLISRFTGDTVNDFTSRTKARAHMFVSMSWRYRESRSHGMCMFAATFFHPFSAWRKARSRERLAS
jgi:hypothetical protein